MTQVQVTAVMIEVDVQIAPPPVSTSCIGHRI